MVQQWCLYHGMAAALLKKPELGLDHEHNTGQVTELSLLLYRGETVFCWFGRCLIWVEMLQSTVVLSVITAMLDA